MTKVIKKYTSILERGLFQEVELIYFRKATGGAGIKSPEIREALLEAFENKMPDDGYKLTPEHQRKGTTYLLSKSKKLNGELRKGCKLGTRELAILDQDPVHTLVGRHSYNFSDYWLPIYRATDRAGNYFDYIGAPYYQMEIV